MSAPAVSMNPHFPGSRRAVAWDKGWRSQKAGGSALLCPYGYRPGEKYMRLEWLHGWRSARESEARP